MNLEILLILFYSGELSDSLEIKRSPDWVNMKIHARPLFKSNRWKIDSMYLLKDRFLLKIDYGKSFLGLIKEFRNTRIKGFKQTVKKCKNDR